MGGGMIRPGPALRAMRGGIVALMTVCAFCLLFAVGARAGEWTQAICQNPNGSSAPIAGFAFSGANTGGAYEGACTPDDPFAFGLSALIWPQLPGPSSATWTYTAPAGSTIAGGQIDVSMFQFNDSPPYHIDAWISSPGDDPYAGDLIASCNYPLHDLSTSACAQAPDPNPMGPPPQNANGVVPITNQGGSQLFLTAECSTASTDPCYQYNDGWAGFGSSLQWADLLLQNDATPTGSGFSGSLLAAGPVHGTAQLAFTAADPAGPGVYRVAVKIDGQTVYQATPNTNAGECAPVGTDPTTGAWIFDYQQPCPESVDVDVPIDTTVLSDGEHDVQVVVQDAAQNSSTVLDQTINTANLTTVASSGGEGSLPPPTTPGGGPASTPVYALRLDARSQQLIGKVVDRRYLNSALRLSGTVLNSSDAPVPDATISVQAGTVAGTGFVTVAQTLTDATGRFQLTVPRGDSRSLRLLAGTATVGLQELVAPNLTLRARALPRARLLFWGRLAIDRANNPPPMVQIEDRTPEGWQPLAFIPVDAHGRYRYTYYSSPLTIGYTFAFRASTPATADWQAASTAIRKVRVHG